MIQYNYIYASKDGIYTHFYDYDKDKEYDMPFKFPKEFSNDKLFRNITRNRMTSEEKVSHMLKS
jgi:hypothetical protein